MARKAPAAPRESTVVEAPPASPAELSFAEVLRLIQRSRERAYQAVNAELIDLYWRVGSTSAANSSLPSGATAS